MKELYSMMRDFLEVEYNQESLLYLLKVVEDAYTDEKQLETKLVVNSTKYYLQALQKELKTAIDRFDLYIAENAKKK